MKKALRLSLLLALLTNDVLSQDCTWTGSVDSSWNNAFNWSCNKVPDSTTDVFIFGGTPFFPVVSNDVVCRNIYITDSIALYLTQAYQALAGDNGYGNRLSLYYTVDNDETMFNGSGLDNARRSLAHYDLSPTNAELYRPFHRLYYGIERANICIKFLSIMIANNVGSENAKQRTQQMYGEALTLRSHIYSELVRIWGDIPYTDSTSFMYSNLYFLVSANMHSTNRDSTYTKILDDLLLAETYLHWRTELPLIIDTVDERITKGAAKALRARIALFAAGFSLRSDSTMRRPANYLSFYQVAREECADLMNHREQHTLNPDYKSIWKNTICAHKVDDGYGEIMLQVKMDGGNPVLDSKLGYYNGPAIGLLGTKQIALVPTYFYLFDSVDTRRDVTAAPYDMLTDGITKTGVILNAIRDGKFRRDWISNPSIAPTDASQYFGLNWPVIRFSDVLLMFAEADNEINGSPTVDAINAFEEVRRRGYGTNSAKIGPTPTNKTGFFDAIVKERSLEFGGEGIRKHDLIRWNLLSTKITETRDSINLMVAGLPPYAALPRYMYCITGTTADNSSMWANSLYHAGPTGSSSIPGAVRVTWTATIASVNYFASNFVANKCELYPYPADFITANPGVIQNPGY
jgi:hypothetical protein